MQNNKKKPKTNWKKLQEIEKKIVEHRKHLKMTPNAFNDISFFLLFFSVSILHSILNT